MESNYVNYIPEQNTPVYHVSKGDVNRTIRCDLLAGFVAKKLTGTESIRMRYKKPNGDISSISVPNTESSYLEITIPAEITDTAGMVYCKIHIDGIGLKAFYINVEKGV